MNNQYNLISQQRAAWFKRYPQTWFRGLQTSAAQNEQVCFKSSLKMQMQTIYHRRTLFIPHVIILLVNYL